MNSSNPPAPLDGAAVASFVAALAGWVLLARLGPVGLLVHPFLAVPCGVVALRRPATEGASGSSLALAGLLLGTIGSLIVVLGLLGTLR